MWTYFLVKREVFIYEVMMPFRKLLVKIRCDDLVSWNGTMTFRKKRKGASEAWWLEKNFLFRASWGFWLFGDEGKWGGFDCSEIWVLVTGRSLENLKKRGGVLVENYGVKFGRFWMWQLPLLRDGTKLADFVTQKRGQRWGVLQKQIFTYSSLKSDSQ